MKKKWLSGLAISFAACFAFGAVGCGEDQTGGGAQSEEQIYSSFKTAYQSTMDYTGAMTVTGSMVEESSYGADSNRYEAGMTYSVNPQGGVGYYKEWDTEDGETEEEIGRIAKYNDGYVMQEYELWDGEEETDSYILDEVEYASFLNTSWLEFTEVPLEEMSALTELRSFTSYKGALETVNTMIAEKLQEMEVDATVTMSVSATTENGAQVITSAMNTEMKEDGETMVMSQTTKMYAKGGKLIKFAIEGLREMKADGQVVMRDASTMEMNIDYKFDQAGYDESANKFDSTSTPREKGNGDYLIGKSVALYINGENLYNAYASIYVGDTLEDVLNRALHNSVVDAYEIENWYTDEACTKVFNPEDLVDFVSVDALYTKNATVKEDCALVIYREAMELNFSTEDLYRVFEAMAAFEDDWICDVYTGDGEYDLTQNSDYEDADKITVNDAVVNGTTFNYEAGNVYFVEYVEIVTDDWLFENLVG